MAKRNINTTTTKRLSSEVANGNLCITKIIIIIVDFVVAAIFVVLTFWLKIFSCIQMVNWMNFKMGFGETKSSTWHIHKSGGKLCDDVCDAS